eukprot:gene1263-biopygen15307
MFLHVPGVTGHWRGRGAGYRHFWLGFSLGVRSDHKRGFATQIRYPVVRVLVLGGAGVARAWPVAPWVRQNGACRVRAIPNTKLSQNKQQFQSFLVKTVPRQKKLVQATASGPK